MSSIYKRNNKLWISYYVNGKKFREPLNLTANRHGWVEARKIQKVKDGELATGFYQEKIRAKKKQSLSFAYKELLKARKNNSKATKSIYDCAYNKLIEYSGDCNPNKIDKAFVEKFEYYLRNVPNKKKKVISSTSVSTYFRILRGMFKYFEEAGYIRSNPFPKIKPPNKEIVTIPMDELQKILEELYQNSLTHYKIIMMFLLTGLRAGELTRLKYKDIDLGKNLISISNTKGKRVDKFPIYEKLRDFLVDNFEFSTEKYDEKVFDYKGKDSLRFWGRFLKKHGFNHYSIHCLRKTFITILVNDGVNIFDVSKLARHKKIDTTLKSYAGVDIERLGERANSSAKLGTLLGTKYKNSLKIVK